MTEKNIDFDVQLLVTLHYFSDDFAGDVEGSRILIEKMIEKNVDFSVQLLVFLHCFSDFADDIRDNRVST